ncbi:MAG: FmdB family transcriptional regulator [Chloroflexi bacterium]|nr:FmdB family transcriptional regulator [Chloroflexota bacterium]
MPTYEYRCTVCSHRFEARQGFHEPALTHCPVCQGGAQRVIHAVGVVFRGSGWYSTDHRGSTTTSSSASTDGSNGSKPSEDSADGKDQDAAAPPAEAGAAAASSGTDSAGHDHPH